jgi:hypothetical protein
MAFSQGNYYGSLIEISTLVVGIFICFSLMSMFMAVCCHVQHPSWKEFALKAKDKSRANE